MIEAELARRWAAAPDFQNRISSWTWFRSAAGDALAVTAWELRLHCELRNDDLADAFFRWAGHVDGSQEFAGLDPVDHAHYACGVLLGSLLHAQPVSVTGKDASGIGPDPSYAELMKWPEDLVLLRLTLTLLEAWRLHLGAPALAINPELIRRHWNSFHENVREESFSAVAFLDLFLGLQPVWEYPMIAGNRPAMQAARARFRPAPVSSL